VCVCVQRRKLDPLTPLPSFVTFLAAVFPTSTSELWGNF